MTTSKWYTWVQGVFTGVLATYFVLLVNGLAWPWAVKEVRSTWRSWLLNRSLFPAETPYGYSKLDGFIGMCQMMGTVLGICGVVAIFATKRQTRLRALACAAGFIAYMALMGGLGVALGGALFDPRMWPKS